MPSGSGSRIFSHLLYLSIFSILVFSQSISAVQDWKPAVVSAVLISVFVIALVYMLIHVLHWEQFKGLIKDELGQTFITFLLVVVLVTALPDAENLTAKGVCGISGMPDFCPSPVPHASPAPPPGTFASDKLQWTSTSSPGIYSYMPFCHTLDISSGYASCPISGNQPLNSWAMSVNGYEQAQLGDAMAQTLNFTKALGYVSSVSGFCNMLGVGFSIAGCSSYGVLRGPTGQLLNAIGTGMMDLQAEKILLSLNTAGFTLSLLLPLGVLLRALHWTRKAGGTLIALALSLYFIFPSVLLIGQGMADQFVVPDSPGYPGTGSQYQNFKGATFPTLKTTYSPLDSSTIECNPYAPDVNKLLSTMNSFLTRNPNNDPSVDPALLQNPSTVDKILFIVLIRNLLMTVLALTATLGATRVLGQALGAEIDVWGIARLS